ncbi:hypothetical protein ACGC1H_002502 [Rhizoctonia solani]|uniref:Uncharacterized protein n=1 Tax=Rhizoctonia solani TaxID=456999 RepID=A0A8H3AYV4_9AGAM|nr:unnamed protein product [Rhizoctonia solani]
MFAKTSAFSSALLVLAAVSSVNAHAAMIKVGATGKGFGVVETTPRDGTRREPFQADTAIIRDADVASGAAGSCGRTLAGGPIDAAAEMDAAVAAGLPAVAADGTITMVMHQVNGDGAGPYTCGVSADASAQNFVDMKIVTNVPGQNSRSNARAQDFPLVAQMPAGTACTGGPNGDACIIRCRNAARAGPFGACAAITNAAAPPAPPAPPAAPPAAPPTPPAPQRPAGNKTTPPGNGNPNRNANGNANGNGNGNPTRNGNGNANGNPTGNANGNGNGNPTGNANGNGNGNGNGNANANPNRNANGNPTRNGNGNGNANGNGNGNGNANVNANANGDGNGNGITNDNVNGNVNVNGNGNGNDNGNGNNANANANANGNSNGVGEEGAGAKANTGDVTIAEAEKALARDVSKRAVVKSLEKKRVIRSRIVGSKTGYWI